MLPSAMAMGEMRVYCSEKFGRHIAQLPGFDAASNTLHLTFAFIEQKLYITSEVEVGSEPLDQPVLAPMSNN